MNNRTRARIWIFGISQRLARAALALAIMVAPGARSEAQSYIYSVLYSFAGGADGADPQAGLVLDAQGNLYGTTSEGGSSGAGTVFKVDTTAKETVLYSFTGGADGAYPVAGLVLDAQGNLYGTTEMGGTAGVGTVFKVDTMGNETVLHSFGNSPDGAYPVAGLALDAEGNLYGTTLYGGVGSLWCSGCGTVFEVDTTGNEKVLHSFASSEYDGIYPYGAVVLDDLGSLDGTTSMGGDKGWGTIFELEASGNYRAVYSFGDHQYGSGLDGINSYAGLTLNDGYLYGTTYYGGTHSRGTAFWMQENDQWDDSVFWEFGGRYGTYPNAGLACDQFDTNNLFGTASGGGAHNKGTAFYLNIYDGEFVLHNFTGEQGDGANPTAGLVLEAQDGWYSNAFGTTPTGGAHGYGTVFALLNSAAATTTTLTSAPNPSAPGQSVTFTAVVTGATGAPPNGEIVRFMKGKTVLGTGTLSGGSASFTTSTLGQGSTAIDAVYGGDTVDAGSTSNAVTQVVKKYPTTTSLSSSLNPSQFRQKVTFSAQVTGSGPMPTGKVAFRDGATSLGTASLSGGIAAITRGTLAVGTHSITAEYLGDTNNAASTSPLLDQVVQ